MIILLTVYGVAIAALVLVIIGIVHRLMALEASMGRPREPMRPVPEWISSRMGATRSHHLVVVVDDSCSICHRTVNYLTNAAKERSELPELVTVLANADSFHSQTIPLIVDPSEHRNLHPGWAPAGLVFSARGLVEAVPVGSNDSIEHALGRLSLLSANDA